MVDRYLRALTSEIAMEPEWGPLHAVNFGGGTPSAVAVVALRSLLDELRLRFGITDGAEISLEANPEDWTGDYAAAARAAGFSRVSLGVQSFDAGVLRSLGRRHTPEQAAGSVSAARSAGFASVSVDLIYGTPGESLDSWRRTVEQALSLGPDHLSAYALTVERGTQLSREVDAGAPAPDPDDQADKYELLEEAAAGAGLVRYEVSNHARPGHACRYNLATWAQGEYVAFGLGAHGHRNGVRRRNVRRLDAYLRAVEAGVRPEAGAEALGGWDRELERLFVGLRRVAGVRAGSAGRGLLATDAGRRLLEAGVVELRHDRLLVLRPLLTDEVNRAVLATPAPSRA
jgi:oxygen-independent coproporphyrinogen-3 oxidase